MNCLKNNERVTAEALSRYQPHDRSLTTTLLCVAGICLGTVAVASAAAGGDSSKPGIVDLEWLAGNWHSKGPDFGGKGLGNLNVNDELEERWSPPIGDSMVGAFRWVKSGKIWLFEFLTIVERREGIFLRWKHFGPDLVGWEKRGASLSYRLIKLDNRKAVFEQTTDSVESAPWRVIYHRTDDKSLTCRLESKGNSTAPDVFRFRLRG